MQYMDCIGGRTISAFYGQWVSEEAISLWQDYGDSCRGFWSFGRYTTRPSYARYLSRRYMTSLYPSNTSTVSWYQESLESYCQACNQNLTGYSYDDSCMILSYQSESCFIPQLSVLSKLLDLFNKLMVLASVQTSHHKPSQNNELSSCRPFATLLSFTFSVQHCWVIKTGARNAVHCEPVTNE